MIKRFKFICDDEKCFFKDNDKALYCYEVVDLLNSLFDENEQLKEQREELFIRERDTKNEWRELKQENEQLKLLIKKVLETTPIKHSLALDLKNSIRELYE